ncbi:MAG: enoyl-CoA hydratase/isomerase family protein [Intrasporangium sp.]|uniref:enoyl-CoA hydratase/isomerase family protein n=1 Tax=Intrasporangium sp. TaxID=1925024 RepID=UPI002647496B|nr:enoyl-CoA hydratase/isomerase family protein [Intrasporangium sp.]MDN5797680.1 enoyl-CoA hydratase/isomerase family protein [Intrasporangium sp.]
MTHPHLLVETDGAVRTLTLNNPERLNAQTPSLWAALAEEAESLPSDVRIVVIKGAGESFSAGIDTALFTPQGLPGERGIVELALAGADAIESGIAGFQRGFTGWAQSHAVVVAQVHGYAIGGGLQLALAADLRVVADDAQLAMRETSHGIVPDLGGTKPLVDAVGYARALEICATGRFVTGVEAGAIGLANVVAPPTGLEAATGSLVDALLAAPDEAVRALKPLLRDAVGASRQEQAARERQAQIPLLLSRVRAGASA